MKLLSCLLALTFVIVSCTPRGELQRIAKSCDSLTGALAEARVAGTPADTAQARILAREFSLYSTFIATRVDTIEKSEADALRAYYQGGRDLQSLLSGSARMSEAFQASIGQLSRLGDDARNNASDPVVLRQQLSDEKKRASEVIALARKQRAIALSAVDNLRTNRELVASIIRKHNNGELPTVIPAE